MYQYFISKLMIYKNIKWKTNLSELELGFGIKVLKDIALFPLKK